MYVKCFSSSSSFFFHIVDLSCMDFYQDSNNDKPFCFFFKMINLGREGLKGEQAIVQHWFGVWNPFSPCCFLLLFIYFFWIAFGSFNLLFNLPKTNDLHLRWRCRNKIKFINFHKKIWCYKKLGFLYNINVLGLLWSAWSW
jgi:hypothetical protein